MITAEVVLPEGWESMGLYALEDRVIAVTFTPTHPEDLVREWADATRADPADHRPVGWRAWQMRRAYRDLEVTGAIRKGGQL